MAGIFPKPSSGLADRVSSIMGMLRGDPQAMAQQMMRTNPQFAEFVRRNQGKSPDQIAQENGIDYGVVQDVMGRFSGR